MLVIDKNKIKQTIDEMKTYSKALGYDITTDDCIDIIDTGYQDEPLQSAVRDWLNAFETCRDLGESYA